MCLSPIPSQAGGLRGTFLRVSEDVPRTPAGPGHRETPRVGCWEPGHQGLCFLSTKKSFRSLSGCKEGEDTGAGVPGVPEPAALVSQVEGTGCRWCHPGPERTGGFAARGSAVAGTGEAGLSGHSPAPRRGWPSFPTLLSYGTQL